MSITVEWLIQQNIMPGFSLIAGDTDQPLQITGINIIDNPDTIPWLAPGTMVLSTGYLLTSENISRNLIQELHSQGCAGLGIKMNRYLNELPQEMLCQAQEYHFPIINIPYASSMDKIANLIYRKLYEEEMSETQRLSLIYHDITECVLKKQKLSKLLPLISNAVSASAFLTNDTFELIDYHMTKGTAITYPFPFAKDSFTLFSETDIHYLKNSYTKNPLPVLTHDVTYHENILHFILFPIKNRSTLLGFLVFLEGTQPFSSTDYDFIHNIHSILCIALMNLSVLTEIQRSTRDIFFYNLLSGNLKSNLEIEPLCLQNNFDFTSYRLCITFKIDEYEGMTIPKRRAFERKVFTLFNEILEDSEYSIVTAVYQTYFILFLMSKNSLIAKLASEAGLSIAKKCCSALSKIDIRGTAGVSKCYKGAETIILCFQQSLRALELGTTLHPKGVCYSYYEDQVYHLMVSSLTRQQLEELYDEQLGILEKYDSENEADLLNTLETYLLCSANITQTAKQLFIHRNTMFYRLDQIRELLHIDFDNSDDLYRMRTGFYIRKLLH